MAEAAQGIGPEVPKERSMSIGSAAAELLARGEDPMIRGLG
jgi:hypothetical protein